MARAFAELISGDREIPLDKDVITIGRSHRCDVVVDNVYVSATHACIERHGNTFVIRDLNSTNGTHVNGKEIKEPCTLQNGDEINIAQVARFSFVDTSSTVATARLPQRRGLWIDTEMRDVWVEGQRIRPRLSQAQYRFLLCLYERQGRPCHRDELVRRIWPDVAHAGVSDAAIDSLAARVRRRIAQIDPAHQYIVTIRSYGFRLANRA